MQTFSNYIIDKMVYRLTPSKKHKKRIEASEDYEILTCKAEDAPIQLPPKNSSYQTKQELEELVLLNAQYPKAAKLEEDYDDDFLWAFEDVCKKNELDFSKEYFKALVKEAASITIKLKYRFNRPRPFQLAKIHGIDLERYGSNTAKTPSFPSGHTTQSQVVAIVLSKSYPEFKEVFMNISDEVSLSRLVGTHHFQSDIEYGKVLGRWMADNIAE